MSSITVDINKLNKIKWQDIGDSPTTKYYTDWNQYEKILKNQSEATFKIPEGKFDYIVGKCGNTNRTYEPKLIMPEESKIAGYHFYYLKEINEITLDSGIYKISFCNSESESWVSQHLIINIKEGADVSLILYDERKSPGSTAVEINAHRKSKSNVALLLNPDIKYPTVYLIRKALYDSSSMNSLTFSTPTSMNRIEEKAVLFENSILKHNSLSFSYKNTRVDNIIDTIQVGKNSDSDISGLGFAFDSSLSSVRGTAVITYDAKKSKSKFLVEALILGDAAKAYTMPMMKIETGDVISATHRSAQYRVSDDVLFYLQSRGLSNDEIISLLVYEKSINMANHLENIKDVSQQYIRDKLEKILNINKK
ncbi:SufB/SufD family protein [Caldisphaera lagunensis]|uniref:SufB/SufD family protein n=1 Tax=Caldisphaera lagunensis TaxID=200415 RepID=UPI0006623C04|nr:SufD family Fe-S cluster assembly protein [Caldisphaera lagunensis]